MAGLLLPAQNTVTSDKKSYNLWIHSTIWALGCLDGVSLPLERMQHLPSSSIVQLLVKIFDNNNEKRPGNVDIVTLPGDFRIMQAGTWSQQVRQTLWSWQGRRPRWARAASGRGAAGSWWWRRWGTRSRRPRGWRGWEVGSGWWSWALLLNLRCLVWALGSLAYPAPSPLCGKSLI